MKWQKEKIANFAILIGLILLGAATRFLPHPANLTAVGATAIFAGVVFPKRWGIWLPLLLMIATDIFLGWHRLVLFTWGSMAVYAALGWIVSKKKKTSSIIGATLVGSTFFFLVTNWAVWQFEAMYPHTVSGLVSCYVAALPFFRNMLIGDIAYVGILFGAYALAKQFVVQKMLRQTQTHRYE